MLNFHTANCNNVLTQKIKNKCRDYQSAIQVTFQWWYFNNPENTFVVWYIYIVLQFDINNNLVPRALSLPGKSALGTRLTSIRIELREVELINVNRRYYMAARGCKFYLLVLKLSWVSEAQLFSYSFSKQQNSAIKVVTYRKMPVTKMLWNSDIKL